MINAQLAEAYGWTTARNRYFDFSKYHYYLLEQSFCAPFLMTLLDGYKQQQHPFYPITCKLIDQMPYETFTAFLNNLDPIIAYFMLDKDPAFTPFAQALNTPPTHSYIQAIEYRRMHGPEALPEKLIDQLTQLPANQKVLILKFSHLALPVLKKQSASYRFLQSFVQHTLLSSQAHQQLWNNLQKTQDKPPKLF